MGSVEEQKRISVEEAMRIARWEIYSTYALIGLLILMPLALLTLAILKEVPSTALYILALPIAILFIIFPISPLLKEIKELRRVKVYEREILVDNEPLDKRVPVEVIIDYDSKKGILRHKVMINLMGRSSTLPELFLPPLIAMGYTVSIVDKRTDDEKELSFLSEPFYKPPATHENALYNAKIRIARRIAQAISLMLIEGLIFYLSFLALSYFSS